MAQLKVSHVILSLALLASATAVPMVPFTHGMMGLYGGLLGGMKPMMGGLQVGQSYSCGASFGSCVKGREEVTMKWVYEPELLAGVTRTVERDTGKIEGLLAVIEDAASSKNNPHAMNGYGGPGLGMFGGGFGAYGMGHGLMGALGSYGMYGQQEPARLDLSLEVQIRPLSQPLDVVLVFTSGVDQDVCTPESLGPVLTGPPMHSQNYGYGSSLLMQQSAFGSAGFGSIEKEFGVITQLTIQGGSNSFKIKGLGDFADMKDLAGRGVALCEDVVMAMGGKPTCTGKNFGVLFCAKLGYAVEAPPLIPPVVPAGGKAPY